MHILYMYPTRITVWCQNLDSYTNRLEKTGLLSYAVSATNLTHQLAWICLQWQEWRCACGRPPTTWIHRICRDTHGCHSDRGPAAGGG